MDEDDEIELLLESNEQRLMEAAGLSGDEPGSDVSVQEDSKEGVLLKQSSITEINYNDEVQELLDDHIVSYMAKEPTKHVLQLNSMFSDEENERSEDDSDEGDNFINEIMAQNEQYGGRFMEHVKKVVGNKNKQIQNSAISELTSAHRLIVERDHLLKGLELKLQEKLYLVEENIEHTRDNISSLSVQNGNAIREPSYYRHFFKKFGAPYFKDSSGFGPPLNIDHSIKLEADQMEVMFVERPCYWIKTHQQKLLDAIKATLVAEKTDKLIKQINKLKAMIVVFPTKGNDEVLIEKLDNCQQDLCSLKSKSFTELISDESQDREYDWMKYSVSLFDGEHSPDECRRFWQVYLKPTINKRNWEYAEDLRLLELAEQLQFQDWDSITKLLGTNRSAYQCFVHFQTRLNAIHSFSRGKWTKEEDAKLMAVINASKIGNFIPWTKVSSYMGDRTHIQIYNRFKNCLNPKLIKGRFTRGEDLLIVAGIEVFGCTYKELSSLMSNRSSGQLRDRYERYLLPKTLRVGTWSLEEDEKLISLVEKYGEQNWSAVAKEMKVRSRTQTRQRYRFIQLNMKTKPGWALTKIKRRNIHIVNKRIPLTQRSVKKVKKEIDEVEQAFNLTKIEKDTFRIEKLKELRDKILINRYKIKRKKKIFSDSSAVNYLLTEFFKHNQIKPPECTKIDNHDDYKAYFNELHLLANYFGHDLQIPEFEDEIVSNPRLSHNLKNFLIESIKIRTVGPSMHSTKESPSIPSDCCESSIDYVPPETDTSIIMNEWWFTPPIDVSRLNFSEFFKRTVFDYSYGMHEDIWVSKMKRSSHIRLCSFASNAHKPPLPQHQAYTLPPNHLTSLGLKSVLLSRKRLKRDSVKGTCTNFYNEAEDSAIKVEVDVNRSLDKFQETLLTLFTWPRALSLNSSSSNPCITTSSENISRSRQKSLSKNIVNLLNNSNDSGLHELKAIQRKKNSTLRKAKEKKSILEQRLNLKRQMSEVRRGNKCKRKMNIEHLLTDSKGVTVKSAVPDNVTRRKRGRPRKTIANDDTQPPGDSGVKCQKNKKQSSEITNQTGELQPTDKASTDLDRSAEATQLTLRSYSKTYVRQQQLKRVLRSARSDSLTEEIIVQPDLYKIEFCLDAPN